MKIKVILAGLVLLAARHCGAIDRTWSGAGTDNLWTTPANWSGGTAPVAGDNLAFLWKQTATSNYNDYADGTIFGQISVGGGTPSNLSSYTFGGNRVVLNYGIATSGSVLYPNTTAKVDFNLTLNDDQTFSAARPLIINNLMDINGYQLTLDNSSSITFSGTVSNSVPDFGSSPIIKSNSGVWTVSANCQFAPYPYPVNAEILGGSFVLAGTASNSEFLVGGGSMVLDGTANLVEVGGNGTLSGRGTSSYLYGDGNGALIVPGDNGNPGALSCGKFDAMTGDIPAPGTLRIIIKGTTPATGYSQLVIHTNYALSTDFFNGASYFAISEELEIKMNYAAQIGDSFLVLQQLSGYLYDPNPTNGNGLFSGLPNGSICDTTNGYSLGVIYDTNGVTLTSIRTPSSPFVLWKGSGDTTNFVYGNRYWSSSNNWAQGLPPGSGSQVQFGPYQFSLFTTSIPPITNDLSPGTALASLLFTGTNYAFYGNAVTVTGGITNQSGNGTNFCHLDVATTGPLTLDVDPGGTLALDGSFAGSGTASKEGAGTLLYSGSTMNSFVGSVVVDNGTMQVDGLFTDGSFTVNSGFLDGTGTVSSVTLNGGTLKPGDRPGVFHVDGDLAMAAGSVFQAELNGPISGSGYDQLQVNGTVTLNGATLDLLPDYSATVGAAFLILVNDGTDPVVGTFAGLPEGAVFLAGGQYFSISYQAGAGHNDVVVTRVNPPGNFTGITPLKSGTMQLQGIGGSNATYTILANTNLATTNWLDIGTAPANGSGIFLFNDSNVMSFPQRFYRVRSP